MAQELVLLLFQLLELVVQPADPLSQQHQFGGAIHRAFVRLDTGAQAQDPRLNLTHGVDDEVGKQQYQQQTEPHHETAHPPDFLPQLGDGCPHPRHMLVNLTAGDHFQLLVEFIELGEIGTGRLHPGLAQILQAIQPGQGGLEIGVDGGIRDGLPMSGEQLAIAGQLLLITAENALVPQHRIAAQGALQIDGLGGEQGRPAGIPHRPLHLVAGQLAQMGERLAVVPDHAPQGHQHQHEAHQYHLEQGTGPNLGHLLLSRFFMGGPAYPHSMKKQNRPGGRFDCTRGQDSRQTDGRQADYQDHCQGT